MKIDSHLAIERFKHSHCDELFLLVDANRDYLRQWLPWVDGTKSSADTQEFIESTIEQYQAGLGPQYVILLNDKICGTCGFHPLDIDKGVGEIGYWLAQEFSNKGIMTKAVASIVQIGFREHRLQRIEIKCAVENTKSRAIPQRLGFHFDGIEAEHKLLHGKHVDHAIYSMFSHPVVTPDDYPNSGTISD